MACMEHECGTCGNHWFNNREEKKCPECKSPNVSNHYDEADDHSDDWVLDEAYEASKMETREVQN